MFACHFDLLLLFRNGNCFQRPIECNACQLFFAQAGFISADSSDEEIASRFVPVRNRVLNGTVHRYVFKAGSGRDRAGKDPDRDIGGSALVHFGHGKVAEGDIVNICVVRDPLEEPDILG